MLGTEKERIQDVEISAYIMGNRLQVKSIDVNREFGNPYHPIEGTIVWQMQQLAESILIELKEK